MLVYNVLSCLLIHRLAWASLPLDWKNRFDPETLAIQEVQSRQKNLHDNDIIWDDNDGDVLRNPLLRSGRLTQDDYWPNNGQGIPYDIAHSNIHDRHKIENALRIIEQRTGFCVTFQQRSRESEYIKFQPGRSCSSNIGRQAAHKTKVILHTSCLSTGIIQHEILHALGFFHEQNRPDRDEHIDIDLENIKVEIDPINYQKLPETSTYGLPYDFDSIMHYGPFDMSRTCYHPGEAEKNLCRPVIAAKRGQHKMGQRTGLSILDVARVQMAYNCSVDRLASERSSKEAHVLGPSVARNESTILEPFPNFSSDPMTQEQCTLQFSTNCRPSEYTTLNCIKTRSLRIWCDRQATPSELQDMALDLSEGPLRAIAVKIHDGRQLRFDNFAVIRKQVIQLSVHNCLTMRTTAELPDLQFSSLLSFWLVNCYGMHIKKGDFATSIELKEIVLSNSTTQVLEKGTFTDLPALKLLALEFGFHKRTTFGKHVRSYLTRLHCGCEFAWFRRWWSANRQLLRRAAKGEVYTVPNYWSTAIWEKSEIYLPIDCSKYPFPTGVAAIDFTQEEFSLNDDIEFGNNVTKCTESASDTDSFPIFSDEPMTSELCDLQYTDNCEPSIVTRPRCTALRALDINCAREVTSGELRAMATAMARATPYPTGLHLFDQTNIFSTDLAPIRRQIVIFGLHYCRDSRTTNKIHELHLANLLYFGLAHCYNLLILKRDFRRTSKLRIIELYNSTVLMLELGTFSDLASLRIVALEHRMIEVFALSPEIRNYLFQLHCSCEFAWYRRWWENNTALLRQAEVGEVYSLPNGWRNGKYNKSEIYFSVDCADFPSDYIDFDRIEFSVNEKRCPT